MIKVMTQNEIKAPMAFRAFLKNNGFKNDVLVNTEKGEYVCSLQTGDCFVVAKYVNGRGYSITARDNEDDYIGKFVYFPTLILAFFHYLFQLSHGIKNMGKQEADRLGWSNLWDGTKGMDLSGRVKVAA